MNRLAAASRTFWAPKDLSPMPGDELTIRQILVGLRRPERLAAAEASEDGEQEEGLVGSAFGGAAPHVEVGEAGDDGLALLPAHPALLNAAYRSSRKAKACWRRVGLSGGVAMVLRIVAGRVEPDQIFVVRFRLTTGKVRINPPDRDMSMISPHNTFRYCPLGRSRPLKASRRLAHPTRNPASRRKRLTFFRVQMISSRFFARVNAT